MLFSGGYAYSVKQNPWNWLTSKEAAEAMAEKVAEWPEKYGCDGIDLDLEDGAGNRLVIEEFLGSLGILMEIGLRREECLKVRMLIQKCAQ